VVEEKKEGMRKKTFLEKKRKNNRGELPNLPLVFPVYYLVAPEGKSKRKRRKENPKKKRERRGFRFRILICERRRGKGGKKGGREGRISSTPTSREMKKRKGKKPSFSILPNTLGKGERERKRKAVVESFLFLHQRRWWKGKGKEGGLNKRKRPRKPTFNREEEGRKEEKRRGKQKKRKAEDLLPAPPPSRGRKTREGGKEPGGSF